jgi:hypothetical protein
MLYGSPDMRACLDIRSAEAEQQVSSLFDGAPPVLVEVRFPGMGVAPDWYLCEDAEDLAAVTARLGAGVEIYLSSVWDLKSTKGGICLKK